MKEKKSIILVTGGAGFIGSNLVKRLVEMGENVLVVDNLNLYYSPRQKLNNIYNLFTNDNFFFVLGDITDKLFLDDLFKQYNIKKVIHLAARAGVRPSIEKPLWYKEDNITGTVNLLELAKQYNIDNFIFVSSSSVYGNTQEMPFREDQNVDYPISPYAASKKACELFCYTYSHLVKIPVTVLRFFTVYGPGNRPDMMMYLFTNGILKGEEIIRYGDGSTKRSYTYIDDIVDGVIKALNNPQSFNILNLGGEQTVSLASVIENLEKVCGKKANIKQKEILSGDVKITWADNTKIKNVLNWQAKTSLQEGCEKLVSWFKKFEEEKNNQKSLYIKGITKRVLILSIAYDPFIGGAEVAIKKITDKIDHYFFDMITTRFDKNLPKYEKIGNVNVYRVGFGFWLDKYLFPILALLKAIRLQWQHKYDIVWGMMANYAGLVAFLFQSIFRQVKYLLTLQSGDSNAFLWIRTWFWYPLYRLIYTRADIIQVISQYLANRARKYGFRGNIQFVPNGADLAGFNTYFSPEELNNLKSELGFQKDDIILVTTSRLVKKNAIDDVIKALPNLDNNIKFLIIGTGKLEKSLKKLTKELKVDNRVVFYGFVPHDKISIYLHMSDIFIRPSLTEGLGNSFLEAMLCKLPIIATEVGGIKDFLVNEVTGMACGVNNPKSIVDAVNKLLHDDNLKDKIIKNGFETVKREYDWELVAEKMKHIFEKI